ncbi:MAG: 2-amino-4-hydroxy-6-hydroxymethyldihydropteridine diphosphokinase [Bacteroidota bacterium]
MKKKTTIFLATGTNLGNKEANLREANRLIETRVGRILSKSSIYCTKAWGITEQADFYNQVLEVQTLLPPHVVLEQILNIEADMGRFREIKWGPRLIDIDLLFYESEIIDSPRLTVPHPELQNRNFVLVPLMEIAPALQHPVLRKDIRELYAECSDPLEVFQLLER